MNIYLLTFFILTKIDINYYYNLLFFTIDSNIIDMTKITYKYFMLILYIQYRIR